jgi:hypothetical protein
MIYFDTQDLNDLVVDPTFDDMAKAFGIDNARWDSLSKQVAMLIMDMEKDILETGYVNAVRHTMIDKVAKAGIVKDIREFAIVMVFIGMRTEQISHAKDLRDSLAKALGVNRPKKERGES